MRARVAQQQGRHEAAIGQFETAAALQDGLAYTEPPYWYYPVRQSLGAALLQAGRVSEAEAQFQAALKRAPPMAGPTSGSPRSTALKGTRPGHNGSRLS